MRECFAVILIPTYDGSPIVLVSNEAGLSVMLHLWVPIVFVSDSVVAKLSQSAMNLLPSPQSRAIPRRHTDCSEVHGWG